MCDRSDITHASPVGDDFTRRALVFGLPTPLIEFVRVTELATTCTTSLGSVSWYSLMRWPHQLQRKHWRGSRALAIGPLSCFM